METKRGITLIMLVVTIFTLVILVTVTILNGSNSYDRAIKAGLEVEINQIELLVNNYIARNSINDFEVVEIDLTSYSDKEKAQFLSETITDNKVQLYVVDLLAIDAHEVTYGLGQTDPKDRYLYSKETKKVYYDLGIQVDGEVYHRIDSMEVE